MAECKIMKCSCQHEFQDQMYGKGMRVWNPTGKGSNQGDGYVCTVCGATTNGGTKKKK